MVAMKKQNAKKSPTQQIKNGGITKSESPAGKLSKNQLKKLKKQEQAGGGKQEVVTKKNGSVPTPNPKQNQKGGKQGQKGGAKKAQPKKESSSDDDDDDEDDSDAEEESDEEEATPGKMDVEEDSDEDEDDDDDDDDDEEDEDEEDEDEEDEEEEKAKPAQKAKKEVKSPQKNKSEAKEEKPSLAKIFFTPVEVELSAKDVSEALGKILNKDDPSLRVDVNNTLFGIPTTKAHTRVVLDCSKPENKQKFKEGFSFKVKNTQVSYERTKDFGESKDTNALGERKFNMEIRIVNLPKGLPDDFKECKDKMEQYILEAVDSKYDKSSIHNVYVSRDRDAGSVSLTSEDFYKDLLALGEIDIDGTSVSLEPRNYKVYASCGSSNYDSASLEAGLRKLVGATNVVDFSYSDGKDPLVTVKDFFIAKKLVRDLKEQEFSGQTYKFTSPFIFVKPSNFGGNRRGGSGFGGNDRRSFGGGRGGGGDRRSFGGRGGGRGRGGGNRYAPY